jgi:hypothetical protein
MIEEVLRWIGMIAAVVAAVIVAARFSDKLTGIGFVVFLVSSTSWVMVGLLADAYALLIQNGVLCLINALGIYRWLLRPALAKATPSA